MSTLADLYDTRADYCEEFGHDLPRLSSRHPDYEPVCERCGEDA